jgi:hypothetical protein
MKNIAIFISPHGFGHATRAAAVLSALAELQPDSHFHIFTQVPEWLFQTSLACPFTYHNTLTDIGMIQKSPLEEDIEATLNCLETFLPFDERWVQTLAAHVSQLKCRYVLCDIAPLGIAVAHAAGISSILVENFTWDWIYEGYIPIDSRFQQHVQYLEKIFATADVHIQTIPVCRSSPFADLITAPVSRSPRTSMESLRAQLGIPLDSKLALITLSNNQLPTSLLEKMIRLGSDIYWVIPQITEGWAITHPQIRMPLAAQVYHPDLVHASDAVIGKIGYSTLAEAFAASTPFAFIPRNIFRESTTLTQFIEQEAKGWAVPEETFRDGEWLPQFLDLLNTPRKPRPAVNGASQAAEYIVTRFGDHRSHAFFF